MFNGIDRYLLTLIAQARKRHMEVDHYKADLLNQIAEKIRAQKGFTVRLDDKLALSQYVIDQVFSHYPSHAIALAWTGGKDSTLMLWMVRNYCIKHKLDWPRIVLIDEGDMFNEVKQFILKLSKKWRFSFVTVRNEDILKRKPKIGEAIAVAKLSKRNQKELKRVGYTKRQFFLSQKV